MTKGRTKYKVEKKPLRDDGGLAADGFKTTASINMRELNLLVCQFQVKI